MKNILIAIASVLAISCAHADYSESFVRITCVPEIRILDIDYRAIHSSSANRTRGGGKLQDDILSKYAFFATKDLIQTCALPYSNYKISTTQTEASEHGRCGASPEIKFSIYINDTPMITNVIFGDGCGDNNSLTRVTIRAGNGVRKSREAEICLKNGKIGISRCEWFFEDIPESWAVFPIGQDFVNLRANKISPGF